MSDAREITSFTPGGVSIGIGLLGASGATLEEAKAERLAEIERRILAIEATLRAPKEQSND